MNLDQSEKYHEWLMLYKMMNYDKNYSDSFFSHREKFLLTQTAITML